MSKIGKKPITIPDEVKVNLENKPEGKQEITVTGPKGSLSQIIRPGIKILIEENHLGVSTNDPQKKALHGLYRSLIANMVAGVTTGWHKALELKGVGFRAAVTENKLVLNIGFSQPIEFSIPQGTNISITENKINITGIDKQLIGETAAQIRRLKPPEPYKGKGIRYVGEIVRKKAGKQAIKAGAA